MRRLQLRAYQALTSSSPVRTGFFRSGWSPSTGAPDRSSPSVSRGQAAVGLTQAQRDEITRAQAGVLLGQHQQASAQIASTYRLAQGVIFIVNNVRYGVFLNRGSSAQAPAMFVEQALATAVRATIREIRQ